VLLFFGRIAFWAAQLILRATVLPRPTGPFLSTTAFRLALNNSQQLLNAHEDVNIALQRSRGRIALFSEPGFKRELSKSGRQRNPSFSCSRRFGPTLVRRVPPELLHGAANIISPSTRAGVQKTFGSRRGISYERARSANEALQPSGSQSQTAFYDLLFGPEKKRYLDMPRAKAMRLWDARAEPPEQVRLENELSLIRTRARSRPSGAGRRALLFADA